jgi:hypothetical protein
MTVVIGYTTVDFSILATDTRLFVNGRKEEGIIDDYIKLYDLPYPLGWCCGAGFNHVLINFSSWLKEESSTLGVNDFNMIVKNLFDRTKEDYPDFIKDIENSSLFATWFYGDDSIKKLHSIGYWLKYNGGINIPKNTYFIDFPYDYTDEMVTELNDKYNLKDEHRDGLEFALNKIYSIFNEISSTSDGVSRICDVGIQFDSSNKLLKKHIKDNIENLIRDIEG